MLQIRSIPESSRKEAPVSASFPLIEGRRFPLVQPSHIKADAERAAAVARGDLPPVAPRFYTRPDVTENLLSRRDGERRGRRFTDDAPSAWSSL